MNVATAQLTESAVSFAFWELLAVVVGAGATLLGAAASRLRDRKRSTAAPLSTSRHVDERLITPDDPV
jgi:hypothetical protein